jgi:predicted ATPase
MRLRGFWQDDVDMLTRLQIAGFKAWQDTGPLRIAPITVLFGANSSGKSSLYQFMLMLKQTAESTDRRRVFHGGGEGSTPVALGSYRDYVFGHDADREIDFAFEWTLPKPLVIEDAKSARMYTANGIGFSARVGQNAQRRAQLEVREFNYSALDREGRAVMGVRMHPSGTRTSEFDITAENYELVRSRGRKWGIPPPVRFYGFPAEAIARFQNADFIADLALELERKLRLLNYLGPLRTPPSRNYKWSGDAPEHVGWAGERTVDAILAASGRKLNFGSGQKLQPFQGVLARWLQALKLIDAFEIVPVAPNSDVYEARVRTPLHIETVLLPDVGFGVSQVLPVVVQCFYAQPNSTIILEQPEIHLHPAVQSELADLFIETIKSREGGANRRIQLLVESHSEHFLRRLQRRIAEQKIAATEVALYFCETAHVGATIRPLEVDEFGNIRNWPRDFFGDQMEDVAVQAKEGLRRQKSSETPADTRS